MNGLFRTIEFTLYELLGYMVPGAIFTFALLVGGWALFFPGTRIPNLLPEGAAWWGVILITYVSGHVVQALCNIVERRLLTPIEASEFSKMPGYLQSAVISRLGLLFGADLDPRSIASEWVFKVCDHIVLQKGVCSDRDIWVYREGYYRGGFLSLGLLAVSVLIAALRTGELLRTSRGDLHVPWLLWVSLIVLLGTSSWLFFNRYRRFGGYRVRGAVLGFLALEEATQSKGQDMLLGGKV